MFYRTFRMLLTHKKKVRVSSIRIYRDKPLANHPINEFTTGKTDLESPSETSLNDKEESTVDVDGKKIRIADYGLRPIFDRLDISGLRPSAVPVKTVDSSNIPNKRVLRSRVIKF